MHSNLKLTPGASGLEERADARCVTEWLVRWALEAPERIFLAEGKGDGWRKINYLEAYGAVRRLGQALLDQKLGPERPLAILSDNGIDHALLALGAMHVGVPVAPISPAYSLTSEDFGPLKHIFGLLQPGLVYASDPQKFAPALAAVNAASLSIEKFLETNPGSTLEREYSKINEKTIAKILFTSASTGTPKGVINRVIHTHGMLCAAQQRLAQALPLVEERPPVAIDGLPWSDPGGAHSFNLVLRNGGTLALLSAWGWSETGVD